MRTLALPKIILWKYQSAIAKVKYNFKLNGAIEVFILALPAQLEKNSEVDNHNDFYVSYVRDGVEGNWMNFLHRYIWQ